MPTVKTKSGAVRKLPYTAEGMQAAEKLAAQGAKVTMKPKAAPKKAEKAPPKELPAFLRGKVKKTK